jgi:hypothetical protein
MGKLKKGSKEAKRFMASIRRKKKSSSVSNSTKRTTKKTMVKKRSKKRSYAKFSKSKAMKPTAVLIGGGLYGAIRQTLDGWVKPITAKVPFGNIADEVVLLAGSYFVHKKMKNPQVKNVALAGMFLESARIGEALRDGSAFNSVSSSSNGASSTFVSLG